MRASVLLLAVVLVGAAPVASLAQPPDGYVFKLTRPFEQTDRYTEVFPTQAHATASLWKRLKIDTLERQTRELRIEFERMKEVRFVREQSIANRHEMEPRHLPALKMSFIHF